jgi:hypothetical protein
LKLMASYAVPLEPFLRTTDQLFCSLFSVWVLLLCFFSPHDCNQARRFCQKYHQVGVAYNPVAVCFPSMCKALGSIPSTAENKLIKAAARSWWLSL